MRGVAGMPQLKISDKQRPDPRLISVDSDILALRATAGHNLHSTGYAGPARLAAHGTCSMGLDCCAALLGLPKYDCNTSVLQSWN